MKFPYVFLGATKRAIADLARPFTQYVTGGAAAIATVEVALKIDPQRLSLSEAAIFLGAVFAGVGALYGAKVYESVQTSRHSADVQIAQAQAGQSQ